MHNIETTAPLPPIFVINLERSAARRETMKAQLDQLGLPYSFCTAVEGAKLEEKDLGFYARRRRRLMFGKDLSPSELGCLLSHRTVYRKMIDENIPIAIVLEDDAILSDDFETVVRALLENPIRWDMIRFLSRPKNYKQGRDLGPLTGKYRLMRPKGIPGGAYAYMLTLHAAQRLNDSMHKNWVPVDILHGKIWQTLLHRIYSINPSPARFDDENESTIGDERFNRIRHFEPIERTLYPLTRLGMKIYEIAIKKATLAVTWALDTQLRKKLKKD